MHIIAVTPKVSFGTGDGFESSDQAPTGVAVALALLTGCAAASVASGRTSDADALMMTLDDEYKAEATYVAVIDKFGEIRSFANIIEAERHDAERAKVEKDRLGISYDTESFYLGKMTAPQSVLAACEQGVAAEIEASRSTISCYQQMEMQACLPLSPICSGPLASATFRPSSAASRRVESKAADGNKFLINN